MNRTFIIFSFLAIIGLFFTSGCKQGDRRQQQGVMPSATGKTGEIVVVMDTSTFNSKNALPLKKSLSAVFKGLPQPEPIFSLINVPQRSFNKGFKTHRNVLRVDIADKYTEPRFVVRKNVYAKPQILIEAQAQSDSALVNLFENRGKDVAQRFIQWEWDGYIKLYKGMRNRGAMGHLREKFGISLVVPKGYKVSTDTSNFTWIAKEAPKYSQGILVYKYPYEGKRTFTLGYQIMMRDRFTKKFVPGPSPKSYMITETTNVKPFFGKEVVDGHTVHEMRGLWKVKNDFMGGPFVSYSILNENAGNVITVDGFVYAPRFEKRDYVRQIEAILQSLDLVR